MLLRPDAYLNEITLTPQQLKQILKDFKDYLGASDVDELASYICNHVNTKMYERGSSREYRDEFIGALNYVIFQYLCTKFKKRPLLTQWEGYGVLCFNEELLFNFRTRYDKFASDTTEESRQTRIAKAAKDLNDWSLPVRLDVIDFLIESIDKGALK